MKKKLETKFSTRQYMMSRDFEIYYYSDKHLSKVRSHTHNYYEFYFFLEGNVEMEIGNLQYPLRTGDVVLIPPGVRHHAIIQNQEDFYRRFVFWISKEYYEQLLTISEDYGYWMETAKERGVHILHNDRISFNAIQTKVFRLIEEIHSERFGKGAKVSLCVNDLILHLNRGMYENNHPAIPKEQRGLYENIIEYIEEHLEEELSLERLAGIFYVSKYHISHIFKDNMGVSVHQYIMKKRLAASRDAILNRNEISEVYLTFGFKDYSSFYRAFKKEYGMSPKTYQNRFVKKEINHNRNSEKEK